MEYVSCLILMASQLDYDDTVPNIKLINNIL